MSLQGRIEELNNRHKVLDAQIHDEMKRPVVDTLALQEMKRKKLQIKEELKALSPDVTEISATGK